MQRMIAKVLGVALAVGAVSASAQVRDPWDPTHDNDVEERFEVSTGRSRLGVIVMGMTSELRDFFRAPGDRGVLVAKVVPGSAAERAGIRVGDILVGVGGRDVKTGVDVIQALGTRQGGQLPIRVIRKGLPISIVANIPQPQPEARLQTDVGMEST
jgi:S1-C subfamily serine protease